MMSMQEFVENWYIASDIDTQITLDQAIAFLDVLTPDQLATIEGEVTPEEFMELWNEIITKNAKMEGKEMVNVDFHVDTDFDYKRAYNVMTVPMADREMVLEVRCLWPEGTQEDYGYKALEAAMRAAYAKEGYNPDELLFPYGEDAKLSKDATAEAEVEVDMY